MGAPYIGEIRMVGFNFAPAGWASCDGQLIPISENDALFTLIGTTYGGDGQETFALPNLQSRVPIHQGQGPGLSSHTLGEMSGVETVTLTTQQIPVHRHALTASTDNGQESNPQGKVLGRTTSADLYQVVPGSQAMSPSSISPVGGSQPHENIQPYLCIQFIISLFGIFPSQN